MLCIIAFQMCLTFPPLFAAGDKIIQIGEGGGKKKKYIFVVSTLRHSLHRLHPLQLAKQTTSISANLLLFSCLRMQSGDRMTGKGKERAERGKPNQRRPSTLLHTTDVRNACYVLPPSNSLSNKSSLSPSLFPPFTIILVHVSLFLYTQIT